MVLLIISWAPVLVLARMIERSWWSPGALLTSVLALSAIIGRFFAPDYHWSGDANFYLEICAVATVVGGLAGKAFNIGGGSSFRPQPVYRRRVFGAFGYACSLISITATFQVLGITLASLISPSGLIRVVQAATYTRYTDGLTFPAIYNVATAGMLAYSAIFVVDAICTSKFSIALFVPVILFITGFLLISTRAPLIFLLLVMGGAALFTDRALHGYRFRPVFSARSVVALITIAGTIAFIFYFIQVLRFGADSTRTSDDVWFHLRKYFWGNLSGFAWWFDGLVPSEAKHPVGFYTFMGVYDNLGIDTRVVGGYSQYIPLTSAELGNIYTLFRGLIQDFGYIGAPVFMAGVGALGGMALSGRLLIGPWNLTAYILVTGFVAFSPVTSFFSFTSNLIGCLLVPVLLAVVSRRSVQVLAVAVP